MGSIRRLLSNSVPLAPEHLDHRCPAVVQAAHRIDPPFSGILAGDDVLA